VRVGELLFQIAEKGATLRCGRTEDCLHYTPAGVLPPELIDELKARKQEVIRILREDEEFKRTGLIQSEHQVFDLARSYFGEDAET
jgi:TubC N-terminal docking domain